MAGIAESMIDLALVTLGIFGMLLLGHLVMRNQFMRKRLIPYFFDYGN